jgi:t-SNARE complex subunit (syntaxin)
MDLQKLIDKNNIYYVEISNENLVQNSEKDINELGNNIEELAEIYKNIDDIIKSQQVNLDKIEDNMEIATLQIIDSKENLIVANSYYNSYKKYQYVLYGFAFVCTILIIL